MKSQIFAANANC